jgi:hypothetical protein
VVIFALLDPDSEYGSGFTDLTESGSGSKTLGTPIRKNINNKYTPENLPAWQTKELFLFCCGKGQLLLGDFLPVPPRFVAENK